VKDRQAYPLSWPVNQIKPAHRSRSQFKATYDRAFRKLNDELRQLGVKEFLVSSNARSRADGLPRGDDAERLQDPSVAIYFDLKGTETVFACGKWDQLRHNVYAIAMTLEAMRAMKRWGAAETKQQFRGFAALPDAGGTSGKQWWTVLGLNTVATVDQIREQYRTLAKLRHPDAGGTTEQFQELQWALQQALQAKGERA
jgi:hypothetical protein